MKKNTSKSIDELIAQAPKLTLTTSEIDSDIFKEKMEKGARLLKIAGVPERPKK
jgi:hypothetical protein